MPRPFASIWFIFYEEKKQNTSCLAKRNGTANVRHTKAEMPFFSKQSLLFNSKINSGTQKLPLVLPSLVRLKEKLGTLRFLHAFIMFHVCNSLFSFLRHGVWASPGPESKGTHLWTSDRSSLGDSNVLFIPESSSDRPACQSHVVPLIVQSIYHMHNNLLKSGEPHLPNPMLRDAYLIFVSCWGFVRSSPWSP